jgi:hypothetical protein
MIILIATVQSQQSITFIDRELALHGVCQANEHGQEVALHYCVLLVRSVGSSQSSRQCYQHRCSNHVLNRWQMPGWRSNNSSAIRCRRRSVPQAIARIRLLYCGIDVQYHQDHQNSTLLPARSIPLPIRQSNAGALHPAPQPKCAAPCACRLQRT